MKLSTLKTQAAVLRTEMLDGREYLVVPTTILVAGVLNGELVPVDEIAANVDGWNGRPIPVRHPQNAAGDYISANAPDVIERQVVGQLFNARFDADRLRAEMWLDVAKVNNLSGVALDALKRIQAGDVVEVSTGYFAQIENASGEWNGEHYTGIQHNLIPDHIALLPDEIGACSIEDGCGANRVNVFVEAAQTPASCRCTETQKMNEEQLQSAADGEQEATTPATVAAAPVFETPKELVELSEAIKGFGGISALLDAIKGIKANADKEKNTLVGKLAANAQCAFSADELTAMPYEALQKIDRMLTPANYAGQSGAVLQANTNEWVAYQAPEFKEAK